MRRRIGCGRMTAGGHKVLDRGAGDLPRCRPCRVLGWELDGASPARHQPRRFAVVTALHASLAKQPSGRVQTN